MKLYDKMYDKTVDVYLLTTIKYTYYVQYIETRSHTTEHIQERLLWEYIRIQETLCNN